MYKGEPLHPQYAKELADLQQALKAQLQKKINDLLGTK